MDQLRELSRKIESAERDCYYATSRGDRAKARARISSLRRQARKASAAYRNSTRGR